MKLKSFVGTIKYIRIRIACYKFTKFEKVIVVLLSSILLVSILKKKLTYNSLQFT